jgi:hypothetical protein
MLSLAVACGDDESGGREGPTAGASAAGKAGSSSAGAGGQANQGGSSSGGAAAGSNLGGTPEAGEAGALSQAGTSAGAGGEGGQSGISGVQACLDAAFAGETRTEALYFTGSGLELGLVRYADPDSFGTSGTTPWIAERFALWRGAEEACVTDTDSLVYTGSHHNFDDSLAVSSGEVVWTFTQTRVDYDTPTSWTIAATRSGELAWGPVTLTLVSCERLDVTESCSGSYE